MYSDENQVNEETYKKIFDQFNIDDVLKVHQEMFVNNFIVRNTKESYSEKVINIKVIII